MKKKEIILQKDGNLIRIGDKWYCFAPNEDGDFRTGEHILYEVDKKRLDKKIEKITEKLFKFVDPEMVMKDALKDLMEEEIDKILNFIEKKNRLKKPFVPKIKKHCIQMKIAGVEIPIR